MRIVSDSCICSACLKKYFCPDYAMIVFCQSFAGKHLGFGSKNIVLIFQTEKCSNRETRKEVK